MKKMKTCLGILATCLTTSLFASPNVHVWHEVYSKSGVWSGTLASINENATFVNANGQLMTNFNVDTSAPVKYGFNYGENDDFDIAYTLTLTQQYAPQSNSEFTSKTCVFVITAKGPAQPDIQVLSYNGAICVRQGDNFYAS